MAFSQIQIHSLHYDPKAPISRFLRVCEKLYRWAVCLRLWAYQNQILKTHRLSVPVISVGNLTTGGTGKTPVVIALAKVLESKGLKVAVLTRGYHSEVDVEMHEADDPRFGDEPYLIQQHLSRKSKVYVGKNRVTTGQHVEQIFRPDVVLLDDGFQYLNLHRDLNILLVDGEHGFGNHHLLPSGPLREPLSSVYRADWVLFTKHVDTEEQAKIKDLLETLNTSQTLKFDYCPFAVTALILVKTQKTEPFEALHGKHVFLLSGIAQPQSFETMVKANIPECVILNHFIFPDHYVYPTESLKSVEESMRGDPKALLLTTEKDWVKLKHKLSPQLHERTRLLRVEPQFDWEPLLESVLPALKVAHV